MKTSSAKKLPSAKKAPQKKLPAAEKRDTSKALAEQLSRRLNLLIKTNPKGSEEVLYRFVSTAFQLRPPARVADFGGRFLRQTYDMGISSITGLGLLNAAIAADYPSRWGLVACFSRSGRLRRFEVRRTS